MSLYEGFGIPYLGKLPFAAIWGQLGFEVFMESLWCLSRADIGITDLEGRLDFLG